MSDSPSTESLLQRAQAGDRAAFGELVERFRPRLEALIETRMGKKVRGWMEAKDIIQETFAQALQSLETFRYRDEESFLRWLGGIAENRIARAATRGKRQKPLELSDELPGSGTSPSRGLRRVERLQRLRKALEGLPDDYREVLRLARIEGLKHEEIAERMGRSHAAVRQLVVRALRQLRSTFGDTESLHLPDQKLFEDGGKDG